MPIHPPLAELPSHYATMGQITIGGGQTISAWVSKELVDARWDRFLEGTLQGQYQQTSHWAQFKSVQGWKPTRVILTVGDEIVGGFQALTRSSSKGNVGYVTKGPVLPADYSDAASYLTQLLREFTKRENLLALVVQQPDFSGGEIVLSEQEFPSFVLARIVDSTWLVDLTGGYEPAAQGFSKTTRNLLRRAVKNGFTAREGGRDDLDTFFNLMLSTCERLGKKPNPPSVEHLYALWDAAHPSGCVRLFLVEYEGSPIVGQLCLGFGKIWSLWKTGRISSDGHNNPTEFSIDNALRHACSGGKYSIFDFGSFDRATAIKMLHGDSWDRERLSGRHTFHMRFGGFPRVLPEARVYIPNPWLRFAYRAYRSVKLWLRDYFPAIG